MKRIPQLDGFRGIAVLMVFFYHGFGVPFMWSGVDLFFVLSGFLITGILLRLRQEHDAGGYWLAFYFRRILRIAPPYLGFLIILSFLFPIPWRHLWYWYVFSGANLASALNKCSVHAMTPLWSLAVEEQFYFVWPWVVLLSNPKTLRKIALGIMIAAPLLRGIFTPLIPQPFIYCLTPFRADSLAFGAFIAVCTSLDTDWIKRWHSFSLISMIVAGALLVGLAAAFPGFRHDADKEFFNTLGYSLIVITSGAALIWALGLTRGFWRGLLASRPLRYMGQISYTFYLYQLAVMEKLAQHLRSRPEVVILAFIVTFLFSAFSLQFFESPILKFKLETPAPKLETA